MAILEEKCTCGTKVLILTEKDVVFSSRKDGKQAVYPDDLKRVYSIFRCRSCEQPLSETVASYNY